MKEIIIFTFFVTVNFSNGFSQVFQEKYLQSIYCNQSQDQLDNFFKNWEKQSIALPKDSLVNLNPIEQHVHEIFEEFYDPLNLEKYGDVQWGGDLYSGVMYIIIQNHLKYIISNKGSIKEVEFFGKKVKESSILRKAVLTNFRPNVEISKKNFYLNSNFKGILDTFVFSKISCEGKRLTSTKEWVDEYRKRINFLGNYIKIISPHWGGDLHYVTHPYVISIVFNKDATQGLVNFRIGWEGGETLFEKRGDEWEMIESKLTWQE